MLHSIADWVTNVFLPLGGWGIFIIAFAESSFFPVPPDVLLIPLILASPRQALIFASICTGASVLGGLFGYYLGMRGGRRLLEKLASPQTIDRVERIFAMWGGWGIAAAGFTPIPYKIFTIASGLFAVRKKTFVGASILGRGGRFFILALLLQFYGQSIVSFITKYFGQISAVILVAAGVLYWLIKRGHRVRKVREENPAELRKRRALYTRTLGFVQKRLEVWGEYSIYYLAGWTGLAIAVLVFAKVINEVFVEEEYGKAWMVPFLRRWDFHGLHSIMQTGAFLGSVTFAGIVVVILGVVFIFRHRRVDLVTVLVLFTGTQSFEWVLHHLFHSPLSKGVSYGGFPSDIAVNGLVVYGYVLFLAARSRMRNEYKILTGILLAALIGLTGLSPMVLGISMPFDVLGGYAVGGIWLLSSLLISEELRVKLSLKGDNQNQ